MATDRDIEIFIGDSFTSIWDLELLTALLEHPEGTSSADLIERMRSSELVVARGIETNLREQAFELLAATLHVANRVQRHSGSARDSHVRGGWNADRRGHGCRHGSETGNALVPDCPRRGR